MQGRHMASGDRTLLRGDGDAGLRVDIIAR
jgi:hypothetical protein